VEKQKTVQPDCGTSPLYHSNKNTRYLKSLQKKVQTHIGITLQLWWNGNALKIYGTVQCSRTRTNEKMLQV